VNPGTQRGNTEKAFPERPSKLLESKHMTEIWGLIRSAAQGGVRVLITGEPGTGKDLIARTIHNLSGRNQAPFVATTGPSSDSPIAYGLFGALPAPLSSSTEDGLLAAVRDGTFYIDEVTDLPFHVQAALLRVFEHLEFRGIGTARQLPFRGEVIAATNRNVESSIREGTFHPGLYYHLNQLRIVVPPLRERTKDIPALARQIVNDLRTRENVAPRELSRDAIDLLVRHDWPGNIRELESCLARAVALGRAPVLAAEDIAVENGHGTTHVVPLRVMERNAVWNAVSAAKGNKPLAAQLLGIGKTTLYRKLKELK
jgi:two-component system response regulator HydG